MRRCWNLSHWLLAAVSTACLALASTRPGETAADDDLIVVASAVNDPNNPNDWEQNWEQNFNQWVFPGAPDIAAGRKRLETQVQMQLAEIERACQLTEDQRGRIQLAARGDLHRFLDQVELLRGKFEKSKHDQQAMEQMWQELQPLQAKQSRGLTGAGSLLERILPKTLTEDQTKEYDAAQFERRRYRYEACIAVGLHMLEESVALTGTQRQTLTKLLAELPPPRVFGQLDQYLITYRLANLPPAAKLKEQFDARQWQALEQQFAQARGMKQHMIEQGIPPEDLDVPNEARP